MDIGDAKLAEEWLRRLGTRDPLRPVVRRLLDGGPVSETDALLALKRLQAPQQHPWRTVALSALVLGQAPLAEPIRQLVVPALRAIARRHAHRGPVHGIGNGCAWSLGIGAALWCAALGAYVIPSWYAFGPTLGIPVALLLAGSIAVVLLAPFVGLFRDREAACPLQSAALRALGRLRDVASIGAMADACLDYREQKRRAGEASLAEVVLDLSSEHYGTVSAGAIAALCITLRADAGVLALREGWEPDVATAGIVLDALERVAGGNALRAVRQVAEGSPHEPLRQRAREALPVLEARHAQERDAARLLRPAEAPASQQLLRPAQAAGEASPDHLLRPASGAGDEPAQS